MVNGITKTFQEGKVAIFFANSKAFLHFKLQDQDFKGKCFKCDLSRDVQTQRGSDFIYY